MKYEDEPWWPRFAAKVGRAGEHECWPWTAFKNAKGYGSFSVGGRMRPAHRWLTEAVLGVQLPSHLLACHTCDNPSCVNPAHVFVGTCSDNAVDMVLKERAATAKLSVSDVKQIRIASSMGTSRLAISRAFMVSPSQVSAITAGRFWKAVQAPLRAARSRRVIPDDMAAEMRGYAAAGMPQCDIAEVHGVSRAAVSRLVRGLCHAKAGGECVSTKHRRRLDDSTVVAIRQAAAAGMTRVQIAAAFGIPEGSVRGLATGRSRRSAGGPIVTSMRQL